MHNNHNNNTTTTDVLGGVHGDCCRYDEQTDSKRWSWHPVPADGVEFLQDERKHTQDHHGDGLNIVEGGCQIRNSPAISKNGETVYITTTSFNVYAINTATGLSEWNFDSGDVIASAATLSKDGKLLYFGNDNGDIFAINA